MPRYEDLTKGQKELYDKLKTAIQEQENIDDLYEDISCVLFEDVPEKEDWEQILTTVESIDDQEHTLTLLDFAIILNKQESIQGILHVAKSNSILEKVLTTANTCVKLKDGQEHTLTPLTHAIILNKQKGIKIILDVAKKDKEVLEKILTTANMTIKPKDGEQYTLTPLAYAINLINQEVSQKSIKAILDVAEDNDMLEKIFTNVREDYLNKTKKILEILKNQEQDEGQKTKISGWLAILAKSIIKKDMPNYESNEHSPIPESSVPKTEGNITNESSTFKIENIDQKDTVKTTNKSIMIGSVCGVIAALAVGGGCGLAGVQLSILAMIGIAVAAAVLVGLVAGGITYAVSKPCNELKEVGIQQKEGTKNIFAQSHI